MFVSNVCAIFLYLFVTEISSKDCNSDYLKNAIIGLGEKENFHYYNWRTYVPDEGRVKFLLIQNENVRQLCKYYMPDTVIEIIFINIHLEYIEPGFFTSNILEQVFIQDNNLRHIEKGVFNGTSIKSLMLSDNKIHFIEEGAFENMSRLEAISLEYNNIKTFDPSWFTGNKALYEVLLSHNQIQEIPENATEHIAESFEKTFYKMYGCLDFDNNKIKYIHPDAFSNLKNYGTISLSNNEILELPKEVFVRFKFLLSLYMNTNNFICFNNETIESFHGVKRLFLAQNRINDDCVLRIKEYFDKKSDLVYF